VITQIETSYSGFDQAAILELWKSKLVTLGQQVKATSGTNVIRGIAIGVTDDGALIIRQDNGSECTVVAGDVTLS
jgi:BirA family biotin operon repressor/biotin-[acetyl-CoA-carboxylase] ligase